MDGAHALWLSMGIANMGWGQLFMMLVGGLLLFPLAMLVVAYVMLRTSF